VATVRWTCFHQEDQEYCQREHKSEEAAQKCAHRTAKAYRGGSGWKTLKVEKGYYAKKANQR